jgi:hypothetical protein
MFITSRRSMMAMRKRSVLAAGFGVVALIVTGTGPAFGGEINGNGQPPGGEGLGSAHANSICAFSGLEDGDGAGFPGPGGAPPQNWGHSKEFFGATPAERKASGFQPGDSCNGHTGFLAGGGEE